MNNVAPKPPGRLWTRWPRLGIVYNEAVLTIRFFAMLKDLVGEASLEFPLEGPTPVGSVLDRLEESYPRLRDYRSTLLIAVNQQYSDREARVSAGDELALFPPVSGGGS